jgi:TPR repeat protein
MRWTNVDYAIRAAGLVLAFGLVVPAIAGPEEDITEAIQRHDYAMAARLVKRLADQGKAIYQGILRDIYANGLGVPQDDAQAARWYRLAADQGDHSAQFNLGAMYSNGQGVPKDDAQAMKWYRLSADQDNAIAQAALGALYANGQDVPRDYVLAYMWSNLAAARGNALGEKNRDTVLAPRMTPADISEAQRLSSEWKQPHDPFEPMR